MCLCSREIEQLSPRINTVVNSQTLFSSSKALSEEENAVNNIISCVRFMTDD